MTMVDKNLTIGMFEFNALSQFSTVFLYSMVNGLVIYAKARAFKAKANATNSRPRLRIWP